MTQQETAQVLQKDLDFGDEVEAKEKQVNDFFEQTDKVLEECNYYITTCMKYLAGTDVGGKNAPIPAWRGAKPNTHEANRAADVLKELMIEAKQFLIDIDAFRDGYNRYNEQLTAYYKESKKLFDKVHIVKSDASTMLDITVIKSISKSQTKIPAFLKQLDTMIKTISAYEPCLKSIKNKINLLKGVN